MDQRLELKIDTAVYSNDPEEAFFALLRHCISGPLKIHARRLVAVIVRSEDAEWAHDLLHAESVIVARDPENPDAGVVHLITDMERHELLNIIAGCGSPECLFRTLHRVFVPVGQKQLLLLRLVDRQNREYIRETLRYIYLLPEERDMLTYALKRVR